SDRAETLIPRLNQTARISPIGENAGPPVETTQPVLLIGGRRDCCVSVTHGDVSQLHAAVVNTGNALILVDLASRTGTFLNDARISMAPLQPGDRVRVGPVPLLVQFTYRPRPNVGDPLRLDRPFTLSWKANQYQLDKLPALIGRRQACQVLVDTPDVSLAHALLVLIEGCPAVMDLGSRSGTHVNGERTSFAWIRDGDELGIGGEKMRVTWKGPARAADEVRCQVTATAAPIQATPTSVIEQPAAVMFARAGETAPTLAPSSVGACLTGIEDQLATLRRLLSEQSADLASRSSELEMRLLAVTAEQTRLAEQAAGLACRERELIQQSQRLTERENAVADAARRVEEFRASLEQASRSLTGVSCAMPPVEANAPVEAPPKTTRPARAGPIAPLVDRPLFGGQQAGNSVPAT
ncbi:MAG: FHA domain-containing protein, partial [Planctomycetes bacterium]|nr:FHA domain-containing protein [Planctomycetota bacterium]